MCYIVDSLVELYCWYPTGAATFIPATSPPFSVFVSSFSAASLAYTLLAPTRFMSVQVFRDVWLLLDNGAVAMVLDAGGPWDYAVPSVPLVWAHSWVLKLGMVVGIKPFIQVFPSPASTLTVRPMCAIQVDGEAACASFPMGSEFKPSSALRFIDGVSVVNATTSWSVPGPHASFAYANWVSDLQYVQQGAGSGPDGVKTRMMLTLDSDVPLATRNVWHNATGSNVTGSTIAAGASVVQTTLPMSLKVRCTQPCIFTGCALSCRINGPHVCARVHLMLTCTIMLHTHISFPLPYRAAKFPFGRGTKLQRT